MQTAFMLAIILAIPAFFLALFFSSWMAKRKQKK
jgi:hypothetical protein